MKKKTYIVSTYNNHEWITTKDAYCKLQLMIQYHLKGYKVWSNPYWLALFLKKHFNIRIKCFDTNVGFEKYVPGTNQITHCTPW